MALFGRRQADAQVTSLTWTRIVQLERQQWVSKRGSRVPSEGTRNVKKHTQTYWAAPNDPPATANMRKSLEPDGICRLELGLFGGVKKVVPAGT